MEEIAWFMSFSSTAAAHVLSFFLRQNVSFARKRKFFAHSALLFSLVLLSYFHLVRSFFFDYCSLVGLLLLEVFVPTSFYARVTVD